MTNRLEIKWKLDGFVSEQRYYCSTIPIDTENLPPPKMVLDGNEREYIDLDVLPNQGYFICLGSFRDNIEKLSNISYVFTDQYHASVVSLLHFNEVNNSTFFKDQKGNVWNGFGSPKISTDQAKFGDSSLYLNGSSYIATPSSEKLNFNSNPYTIECWFYCNVNTSSQQCIASKYQDSETGWTLQVYNSKLIATLSGDGIDIQGEVTLNSNQWYHVALSGQTNSHKLFLNGVQDGPTFTGSTTLSGSAELRVGVNSGPALFKGYIDEFRVTSGVARYTSNFTVQDHES